MLKIGNTIDTILSKVDQKLLKLKELFIFPIAYFWISLLPYYRIAGHI